MKTKFVCLLLLAITVLAACASPTQLPATPTPLVLATETLPFIITETASPFPSTLVAETPTAAPDNATPGTVVTSTAPASSTNICADPQVTSLIDSLKTAVNNGDGPLLASLVSPASGMDVRFFRDGMVVNYDQEHAKFLFETTFEVDWGAAPGSGENRVGSFHDVVVPELVKSFGQPYTLHCNELKYGGATYDVTWPYSKDFYSIYFPGTETNGNMDWHTWVAGIEYVSGKPYLYALMQFFWEP